MAIQLSREQLLQPLQKVIGVVEKRQTLPILSTVLFEQENGLLRLTGTDLEIELNSRVGIEQLDEDRFTVPGRKLMDICRSLPEQALIELSHDSQKIVVKSGNSSFKLQGLPAEDYPAIEDEVAILECTLSGAVLSYLIQHSHYAMAQQDVRYYLNGMMWEFSGKQLTTVAIDGHRMSYAQHVVTQSELPLTKAIIPRKGIAELSRLLGDIDDELNLKITKNHIQVSSEELSFTSKLIDGNYPDYRLVIPKNADKALIINKKTFQQALVRASILSNEKFKGISFELTAGQLTLIASNTEHEQATETLVVDYDGDAYAIGFNVSYLLEALNAIDGDTIKFCFSTAGGSVIVEDMTDDKSAHIIMPMRL